MKDDKTGLLGYVLWGACLACIMAFTTYAALWLFGSWGGVGMQILWLFIIVGALLALETK